MNKIGLGIIIGFLVTWGVSNWTNFVFSIYNLALYAGIVLFIYAWLKFYKE